MNPTEAQEAYGWWAWAYDFQTLVAAMVALAGAGLTVWVLHRQTRQGAEAAMHQIRQAERAIRAQRDLETERLNYQEETARRTRRSIEDLLVAEAIQTAILMAQNRVLAADQPLPIVDLKRLAPPAHPLFEAIAARLIEIDPTLASQINRFHSTLRTLYLLAHSVAVPRNADLSPNPAAPVAHFRFEWRRAILVAADIADRFDSLRGSVGPTQVFDREDPSMGAGLRIEAERFKRKKAK